MTIRSINSVWWCAAAFTVVALLVFLTNRLEWDALGVKGMSIDRIVFSFNPRVMGQREFADGGVRYSEARFAKLSPEPMSVDVPLEPDSTWHALFTSESDGKQSRRVRPEHSALVVMYVDGSKHEFAVPNYELANWFKGDTSSPEFILIGDGKNHRRFYSPILANAIVLAAKADQQMDHQLRLLSWIPETTPADVKN